MIPLSPSRARSIGRVMLGDRSLGTAFVADPEWMLTAAHVVGDLDTRQLNFRSASVNFGDQRVEFDVAEADVDWLADVALLRPRADAAALPPAIPLHSAGVVFQRGFETQWSSWGYPPQVNEKGFGLGGSVVATDVEFAIGGTVVQLQVEQFAVQALGGISGAPVIVAGQCIGLIRKYPEAMPFATLYAASLDSVSQREVGAKIEGAITLRPDDLARLLVAEIRWSIQSLRLPSVGGFKAQPHFVEPRLLTKDGQGTTPDEIASGRHGSYVVISGLPGSGKSCTLALLLAAIVSQPIAAGDGRVTMPLLLDAAELARFGGVVATALQGRNPSYGDVIAQSAMQDRLTRQGVRWIIVLDGFEGARRSSIENRELGDAVCALDDWCRSGGHGWIAAVRSVDEIARMVMTCTELRVAPWNSHQAKQFLEKGYGPDIAANAEKELAGSSGRFVRSNPFLLRTWAETFGKKKLGAMKAQVVTPASLLRDFTFKVLSGMAQAIANGDSLHKRLFERLDPRELAGAAALASLDSGDSFDAVESTLVEQCEVSLTVANDAAGFVIKQLCLESGFAVSSEDGLAWSHLLFRDSLAAGIIADRFRSKRWNEVNLSDLGRDRRFETAVALAIVEIQERKDVMSILFGFSDFSGMSLLIEFLRLGGKLPPSEIETLVRSLAALGRQEKEQYDKCVTVLSSAVQPFDALLKLAGLPQADTELAALIADESLPEGLRAHLAESVTELKEAP